MPVRGCMAQRQRHIDMGATRVRAVVIAYLLSPSGVLISKSETQ